ncbi:hypothetical protein CPT_Sansa121 [Caulobacter phage Sansa]|uniref:Uncharacterized protein n=1 Tax=Caulobacter phage Sansa TaxID=1675600 RepID=A0A0K1LML0_9CAUD|nr:hypothetical protein HOR07_gp006 [Caulobacter phage Sansa]YP_009785509.1 hypothetical protein HOR07_gp121 [Caulobacter phage Sansa]AKU43410.1 hypothetical protein CPT_Sansa6 [Caulobacter phage Sansa]AKU43525.1 hypothetical protein CPT_Sansa121 [Caulobacter phage Sansa]
MDPWAYPRECVAWRRDGPHVGARLMSLPVPFTGAPVRPASRRLPLVWAFLASAFLWALLLRLFGVI